MLLFQFHDGRRLRCAASTDGAKAVLLDGEGGTYQLAQECLANRQSLADVVAVRMTAETIDARTYAQDNRFLAPLLHPEPSRCTVSGTGLTHLGSAAARDEMHNEVQPGSLTDSMRMFRMGVEGGRPTDGSAGVQPEWFYKGDGSCIVPPGAPLASPSFALDAGEEPEVVGLYLIDGEGQPVRLGWALGNDFSDHETERENYLWLAHSKLRPCSFGPAMLIGDLPDEIEGTARVRRGRDVLWERRFHTGQAHMSHAVANLEYHHFKYDAFRRPGDVHVHFFGTATLSFTDGIRTQPEDAFEVEAPGFGPPLRNPLGNREAGFRYGGVRAL